MLPVDPLPFNVTDDVGSVMVWFGPALATMAALTVMVTCEVLTPPFTDNWKTYVPWIRPVTVVLTAVGVVIVGVLGPETLDQA